MAGKTQYIHRRNIKFKNEIAKADKERILGVAMDTSKTFHRVIIFNFLGKMITEPFSIDTLLSGYSKLTSQIAKAQKRIKAEKTCIALETPAKYTENLVYHLKQDYKRVVFVPPYEVSQNRNQRTFHGLKTDDIDAGAVADLLIRGEFSELRQDKHIYKRLQNLVHWREQKLNIRTMIKNQIGHRLAKIYPGLNCTFDGKQAVYSQRHEYESLIHNGLIEMNRTPVEMLEIPENDLLRQFGYGTFQRGRHYIRRLKKRIEEMLLPEEMGNKMELDFLARDTQILKYLDGIIENAEKEIVELGSQTEAKYLFGQIKGISDLMASMLTGLTGSISKYKTAGHIYSYAGLNPKRRQSGSMDMGKIGIKRHGNSLLRCLLFRMASRVIISNPMFNAYYHKLKREKNKSWKELRIIVCHKLNKIMFALMRDKVPFRI